MKILLASALIVAFLGTGPYSNPQKTTVVVNWNDTTFEAKTYIDRCEIKAVFPDNWNDKRRLAKLGEELMHCLGYSHKEAWR